jgi:hypothetical protein
MKMKTERGSQGAPGFSILFVPRFLCAYMQEQERDIGQFNTPVKQPQPFYSRQKIVLAKAEACVVVAIGGPVVVAIGAAQVHGVVVPTAAAQHAVGAAVVPSLWILYR